MSDPVLQSPPAEPQSWRERMAIPRATDVTGTQAALGFLARFYDEVTSGLPDVLMPTIQAQLGLSLTQVGLLRQLLDYAAAGVEPINGLLLDVWRRKWLMGFGAAAVGLSVIIIGAAYTFFWLIVAYIVFGLSSGPLAHTGDVVVVESYPDAPDRAYARSTLIDTTGALLAPLLVSLVIWQGWSWRWLMVAVGLCGLFYAAAILKVGLPLPQQMAISSEQGMLITLRQNVSDVIHDRKAMRWLLLLFLLSVLEIPAILKTVWLAREAGMSQALIGLYVAAEMGVSVVSLIVLDFWRRRAAVERVLAVVTVCVAVLYPLWLLLPGVWTRFALMIPLTFFFAMFWPILKANSLASVPGRTGAVTALNSLFGLAPLSLLFAVLAEAVSLTSAMLGVHVVTVSVIAGVLFFTRSG